MKKLLLLVLALMLTLFVCSCENEDKQKIEKVKTTNPANNMTTIVNDENLANDEFSPRY